MSEEDDAYLWDRSGKPDPEIQRLEQLLGRYRHRPRRTAWRVAFGFAAAAAIAVVAFAGWLYFLPRFGQPGNEWAVTASEGTPLIGGAAFGSKGLLRAGQQLRTDSRSRAEIKAGSVGRIQVGPDSIVGLVETGGQRHRLSLERGRIEARLWSPPFTFGFTTPAATTFDLGCAFSLEVVGDGEDLVHVTSGWVSFQWEERQQLIPAGASAVALRGRGPGTPYFDDASDSFKAALRELDFGAPASHQGALQTLLAQARTRDVYSLIRLARWLDGEERALLYQRAEALSPRPVGDVNAWVDSLGLGGPKKWWVHWKDAL